jgi:hypothetical protein
MKMTKTEFKKTLKMDYLEAMAVFAERLEKYEDAEEARDVIDEFDDKAFDWAMDSDLTDEWMAIYTGLIVVLDAY